MPKPPQPTQGPLSFDVQVTGFVPLPSPAAGGGNPTYPNGFFSQATYAISSDSTGSWIAMDSSQNPNSHRPFVRMCHGVHNNPNGVNVLTKGIIMHLRIYDANGNKGVYVPLDVSWIQYEPNNPNNLDVDGSATFPQSSVSTPPSSPVNTAVPPPPQPQVAFTEGAETIEFYNLWTNHNGNDWTWRMFVLIQRVSDGAIGIIDPDLENDN
ncbi:MAG: hypothetical protein HZA93_27505 [Verrucomicrobia bacterium]|nr:hypothetical protein [Verrucomicrobiota bacterium]